MNWKKMDWKMVGWVVWVPLMSGAILAAVGPIIYAVVNAALLSTEGDPELERVKNVAAIVGDVSTLVGAVVVSVGVWVALHRANAAHRTAQTTEDGLITERFTKAVEQLGDKESMAVRLGGIYALEKIAQDAPERYHWTVMEVLCAYVRDHKRPEPEEGEEIPPCPTDIKAICSVLKRRDSENQNLELDLRGADLRRANLWRAQLRGAWLPRARLERAWLAGANLAGSYLLDTNLRGTNLEGACLWGVEGLTQDQVNAAKGDASTVLPDGLIRPVHWTTEPPLPPMPALGPG